MTHEPLATLVAPKRQPTCVTTHNQLSETP